MRTVSHLVVTYSRYENRKSLICESLLNDSVSCSNINSFLAKLKYSKVMYFLIGSWLYVYNYSAY